MPRIRRRGYYRKRRMSTRKFGRYNKYKYKRFKRKPVLYKDVEFKNYDTEVNSMIVPTTWANSITVDPTPDTLCAPVMGTDSVNRIGRKIVLKSVYIKGTMLRAVGSDKNDLRAPSTVTAVLVLDKQTNGLQLNPIDLFVPGTVNANDMRNLYYTKRFKILWKKRFTLADTNAFNDGAATGSISGNRHHFSVFRNLHIPVEAVQDDGDVGDIVDNSLHFLAVTTSADGADYINYQCRVRFIDM